MTETRQQRRARERAERKSASRPGPNHSGQPRARQPETFEDWAQQMAGVVDFGPRTIVAGEVGAELIAERDRHEMLAGTNTDLLLTELAQLQRELDIAITTDWNTKKIEQKFVDSLSTSWASNLRSLIDSGHRLAPPVTVTQLIREAIEFGSFGVENELDRETICLLLLSISSEQQRDKRFAGDIPTVSERNAVEKEMAGLDAEALYRLMRDMLVDEVAAMLFNAPLKLEVVQATTFETWFSLWPSRVTNPTLGKTPAEAFEVATGLDLVDLLRLGDIVRQRSWAGEVVFDTAQLTSDGASEESVRFMSERMSMKSAEYRDSLARDRRRGDVQYQRYTMTQFPFLEIDSNKFILLRHQWGIDRFIGNQLYWETYSSFAEKHTKKTAGHFSQAMDYMFEELVGRTIERIVATEAAGSAEILNESQMQDAWQKKGKLPSVCDWAILGNKLCVVIDATNHPLDFKIAQGLGDAASYAVDIDKIFTNKKYEQLISTIDHLANPGWQGKSYGTNTFVPLVVVPDSSVPNTIFAEMDFQARAHPKFARFQQRVFPPGTISYSDLRLLEGICERSPRSFATIAGGWRYYAATTKGTLQQFIDKHFQERPLPRHVLESSRGFQTLINERI
ncbi:hypothetical protein [Nocardia neocaledoniensis]|uniref:hypothetical protein n=1 Tax=Nocardia neocaledoniensis TaxID=236511 RepID=UPI002457D932|nr:hypothetical protein [Nocardia neocaledoniensis]